MGIGEGNDSIIRETEWGTRFSHGTHRDSRHICIIAGALVCSFILVSIHSGDRT